MSEIRSGDHSIFIQAGIAKEINKFFRLRKKSYSKVFILVDENSLKHCYPQLVNQIEPFKNAEIIEIESGEDSKNIEVCAHIWATLSEYGADRSSLFVNLGGGVITDMGGFIASTFKRGMDFINIPTTLLAQVDASVGGKTGIDLNNIKNEIGVFSTPVAVFVDSTFLKTLDKRQVLSGFAEIIKHGLIADGNYWKKIMSADLSSVEGLDKLIQVSIAIKNTIVQEDPKERGIRKVLNFGHTIGHAIETFSLESDTKKPLLHGEAIAIGMVCEAYLSQQICKLPEKDLETITQFIFEKYKGLKIDKMDTERLIELMKHDKKNEKGDIHFSLLSAIGTCEINKKVKADQIIEALEYYSRQLKLFNSN